MGAVGFGAGRHQHNCIRQGEPRFGQAHRVGDIHRRLDDGDDLRVGKAHILAGAHHKPTAGRGQIPGFQQPGQIVERRIRIGAAHGFLVSRHDIIVVIAVPVVPHGSAAGDLLDHIQRDVFSLRFGSRRRHCKIKAAQCLAQIAARALGKIGTGIVLHPDGRTLAL